jgi:large repetitive protein
MISDWVELPVPGTAPQQVTVQMEIDRLHYRLGTPEAVAIGGLSSRRSTTLIETTYYAEVTSINPQVSFGDRDVVISGRARDRATNAPLPLVPVKLVLTVNGFERASELASDIDGNFSYTFKPLAGEAGIYKVSTIHPDILDRPESGQFTISRVTATPGKFTVRIPRNFDQPIPIKVTAGDGTVASNVRVVYAALDQADGSLTPGITINTGTPVDLASKQTKTINLVMRAGDSAPASGRLLLTLKSNESGNANLAKLEVNYQFSEAVPALFVAPNFVQTGVTQGGSVSEKVVLENRGLAAIKNARVELLGADGFAPPNWIYLSTQGQQGDIGVGETREIGLLANPGPGVLDDVYQLNMRVTSDNLPTRNINVFVAVTQSGKGNVLFKVSDIYTATLDGQGNLIQGLAGARIRVQNEQVFSLEETLFTDAAGEAFFNDLPAGNYIFRASANNHADKTGRFKIKPGITVPQDVFLDYNLVTVNWSVREITIEDRYEITLSATFETNVPAAVVVADPASTLIPDMQVGDVFYGEITLTNHGLIRADNLEFTMPPIDQYFKFEMMRGIPDSLEAKARVTIPYRIVSLQPLDPDGAATGGGCYGYRAAASGKYSFECANGATSGGSIGHGWYVPGSGGCSGSGIRQI